MKTSVASIVSIGSGTIIAGRKSKYVNDSYLTSGSVVSIGLDADMNKAAGAGGLKYVNFTAGSPANGNSFQVVLNGPADKNIPFNYTIINA